MVAAGYKGDPLLVKSDVLGEKVTHSLILLAPQHFVLLRSIPLRPTPLRAAPIGGSFMSERVAIY